MDTTLNIIALNDAMQRGMQGNIERGFQMYMNAKANALNMAQRRMEMEIAAAKTPLEMESLRYKAQDDQMSVDMKRETMAAEAEDKANFAAWWKEHRGNPVKIAASNAPEMKTGKYMNMVGQMQDYAIKTSEVWTQRQLDLQNLRAKDPLVKQQIATAKANEAAALARQTYYESGGTKGKYGAIEKEQIIPGVYAVRVGGSADFKIVKEPTKKDLTVLDKSLLYSRLSDMRKELQNLESGSEDYMMQSAIIRALQKEVADAEIGRTSTATPQAPPQQPPPPSLAEPPKIDRDRLNIRHLFK